ncbi:MAG: putative uroporphyrinogen-III C-methyltransferase [Pseudomonadota bacterium]
MSTEQPTALPDSAAPLQPAPTAESAPRRPLTFWVPLVLAVLAVAFSALLWEKLSRIQGQLARQSADAGQQSLEAKAWAKQAQDSVKDSAARMTLVESRLGEAALQRAQLEELIQSLSRSRDENLVLDIESSLRLAQQQAQLTSSLEPLLGALKTAQQRLHRASNPRLMTIQRAIDRDLEAVKSAQITDLPGMLLVLDDLVAMADELPLAIDNNRPSLNASQAVENAAAGIPVNAPWWKQVLERVMVEARGLLRVSRIDSPEAALLAPEQGFFLRENLKLKLLNARLSLLARQGDTAKSDLQAVSVSLKKYFDPSARKTQQALQLLDKAQSLSKGSPIPRLDGSLAALATASAGK